MVYANIWGIFNIDGKCYHIYIYIAYMDPMGRIVNFGVLPTFDF